MSDPAPRYRTRNKALAVVAFVVAVAAAIRLAYAPPPPTPAVAPVTVPPATIPRGSSVSQSGNAATGATIAADVAYAGSADALPDAAKVFVFVRPVGQRMPLAVQVFGVHDLPARVEFSRLLPASVGQTVEVVARLSLAGTVAAQPGDPESVSQALRPDAPASGVSLVLGAVAPDVLASMPKSVDVGNTAPANPGAWAPVPSGSPSIASAGPSQRLALKVTLGVKLPAATTVYLIVRAPDAGPMPLAVKRLSVADLPADLVITDADAMVAGRSLGDAARLQVVARASVSGDVTPRPGDYEGSSPVYERDQIPPLIPVVIDHAL